MGDSVEGLLEGIPMANLGLWSKSLGIEDPSHIIQAQLDQIIEAMTKTKPNVVTLGDEAHSLARGRGFDRHRRLVVPSGARAREGRGVEGGLPVRRENNAKVATAPGSGATIARPSTYGAGTKALYDYTIAENPAAGSSAVRSSSRPRTTRATTSGWPSGSRRWEAFKLA